MKYRGGLFSARGAFAEEKSAAVFSRGGAIFFWGASTEMYIYALPVWAVQTQVVQVVQAPFHHACILHARVAYYAGNISSLSLTIVPICQERN
jgi:hypothetical protein